MICFLGRGVADDDGFDDHERSRWAGRSAAYERSFAPLCAYSADALLDAACVEAGSRVLDVGTGPGTVAALACGRGALVTAVDAEPSMVDLARRRLPKAEAVRHAALPDLPFPDRHFDAAVANFVMNHVGHPAAAIAELRRIVRPGGRIAVTIWPYPLPPLQQLWGQIFDAAGGRRPAVAHRVDPDKDFPRTAEGLTSLLAGAGLDGSRCDTITWVHRTDPEDWWSGPANGIGALGLLLESQPPEMVVRIRKAYDELTAAYRDDDGLLALPTAALLASALVA
ncbi:MULTISPECIES: class I SAM-dependent methyltransferase [unclassified Micromonospora]|uniref:class I SAM-dependent methyltransferase n=1 Tax=unclassified Micromonospora TaxID=2617518 RepID=UPI001C21D0D4|nr:MULTISPECIES: class I SAM-dependent methyltransferase [unclassified Micromonospora]MBU8859781.1 class I SAM-dependent methyltransferase [Micromonospora sp. WMMB482]MDM4779300.1 class I SAM-dependent methyltransferase [Micromonospora sp. b486]